MEPQLRSQQNTADLASDQIVQDDVIRILRPDLLRKILRFRLEATKKREQTKADCRRQILDAHILT